MAFRWESWSDEKLLDVRLCDLGVAIEGSWLERPIARVLLELSSRGLVLRPHFWLSDEWFSPAGVPGVAVPFYLAHPRLARLERKQMLGVEGGTLEECLKILRHELGHAVQHGYQVQRRRRWQELFGKSSTRYPESYMPRPRSKRYVQHLDFWYAQSHPDEDFAESFAVWLGVAGWRRRYTGWPALRKLDYVDRLMQELRGARPLTRSKARDDALPRLRKTLREYYDAKRRRYSVTFPHIYDRDLRRLFSDSEGGEPAWVFLRQVRREVRELVSRWTGEYEYTLDYVMREMIGRCRELGLRVVGQRRRVTLDFAILLTVHTMNHLYSGRAVHYL
jgi:hypothetical protein